MATEARTLEQAFGEIVRGLRQKASISQERLAQYAELSTVYISEIERGKRSVSLRVMFKVASGLGITPNRLVQRVEKLLDP